MILGLSVPHFWLAIVLVIVFAVLWNVLPAAGMGSTGGISDELGCRVRYLVLPVVTLSMIPMGVVGRMVRSTVLEILATTFRRHCGRKGCCRGASSCMC